MKKEARLQIRVSPRQMEFLREYSSSKNITISRMIRDFIDWLSSKESKKEADVNGNTK